MMRRARRPGRRFLPMAVALSCAIVVSSCASISVNDLPQPGNSYRGGYDVVIEFASALNLPDRAQVVLDGAPVGRVETIAIGKSGVDVTVRIDRSVKIPSDIHAVLQQATVLGDIYVALERGPAATGDEHPLRPNDRILLARNTSPPQLEDTIANFANFVTSGSLQRLQNGLISINRVTPEHIEQVHAIAQRVSADLSDLSVNIDTVDKWLTGLSDTVQVMADDIPFFRKWFSPEGVQEYLSVLHLGSALSTITPSLGSIYNGGYWLIPFLHSFGIALGAVQKSKWAFEGEYRPWRKLMLDLFLPEDKYPAMNIVSVQTPDGREISRNVEDVLRMLGAVP